MLVNVHQNVWLLLWSIGQRVWNKAEGKEAWKSVGRPEDCAWNANRRSKCQSVDSYNSWVHFTKYFPLVNIVSLLCVASFVFCLFVQWTLYYLLLRPLKIYFDWLIDWVTDWLSDWLTDCTLVWGTAAAAPPPFRPGNPALCGSRPLVTPYYCRLGDLLCYTRMLYLSNILCVLCMCNFCFLCFWGVFSFTTSSFSTLILLVGSFDL